MDIYIFGSRGPNNNFKLDSDVDIVVVETALETQEDFRKVREKYKLYALEHSHKRAGLDLFQLKETAAGLPELESVYDFGDRTIHFSTIEKFQEFRKTWKMIGEADLMAILLDAAKNCP